ncbi:MAG: hypothetical protein ACK4N5_14630, partial [Myxococcales bacterium]
APFARWDQTRQAIYADIWSNFWNEERGHFVQHIGSTALDDLSAGQVLAFADDDEALATITLPQGLLLPMGAGNVARLTVSTNGWVGLAPGGYTASHPANEDLAGTALSELVAPFWDDLKLGTGQVRWDVLGTQPDRRVVIGFEGVGVKVGTGVNASVDGELRFQVALFESGKVELRYGTLQTNDPQRALGSSATVGVLLGGRASQYSHDLPLLQAPRSIAFEPVLPARGTAEIAPTRPTDYVLTSDIAGTPLRARTRVELHRPNGIVFSEVMAQPPSSLPAGQWVELRSRLPFTADLTGAVLTIDGKSATLPSLQLPAGGHLVLGVSADPASNGGAPVAFAYGPALAFAGAQGSVEVSLRTRPLAALQFGTSQGNAAPPGAALVRDDFARALNAADEFCAASTVYDATSGARGTPGAPNDGCHYRVESRTDFVDVSGTSRPPVITSTTTGTLTPPFPVTLFGDPCPTLLVSRHGFAACGNTSSSHPTNGALPATAAPNGVLAPFWDEQHMLSASRVFWDVLGSTPNQVLVVQWSRMDFVSTSRDANLNYQLKLHENGDVEFQYAGMDGGDAGPARASGSSATIGLENNAGRIAIPLSQDSADAVKP